MSEYNYDVLTYYCKCSKCRRKILVQMLTLGTSHDLYVTATCAECLKRYGIDEEYARENPDDARRIEEWVNEE